MNAAFAALIVLSVTVLLISLALVREIRLRRALQRLLARLPTFWRTSHARTAHPNPQDDSSAGDPDRRLRQ